MKVKRMLSVFLSLSVILSNAAFGVTSAVCAAADDGWTTILEEDFSENNTLDKLREHGFGVGYDEEFINLDNGTLGFINNPSNGGSSELYYNFDNAVNSGKLMVSYSIKPEGNATIANTLKDSSSSFCDTYLSWGGHICYRYYDESSGIKELYNTKYTSGEWINVTSVLDFDAKKAARIWTKQDGTIIIASYDDAVRYEQNNAEFTAADRISFRAMYSQNNTNVRTGYDEIDNIVIKYNPNRNAVLDLSEDFENYSTIGEAVKSGWIPYNRPSKASVANDSEKSKVIKLAENGAGFMYSFNSGSNENFKGTYEITGSVKTDANADVAVDFGADSSAFGNTAFHFGNNGYIYLSSANSTSRRWYAGTYEPGKWYDFKIIADTIEGSYSAEILSDGKRVAYRNGISMYASESGLGYIRFCQNTDGVSSYFDSFSVKEYTGETDKILLNDDFESYTALSDGEIGKSAYDNVWKASSVAGAPEIDSATFEGRTVLKLGNGKGLVYSFDRGTLAKSGKLKFKTTVYITNTNNENRCRYLFELMESGRNDGVLAAYADKDMIAANTNGTAYRVASGYKLDEWYDFIVVADFDKKTYNVQIVKGNDVIAQLRDIDMVKWQDSNKPFGDFSGIQLRSWGNTVYVDSISVERIDKESDRDLAYLSFNFNSYTTKDDAANAGWKNDNSGVPYDIADSDSDHGKSIVLPAKNAGIKHDMNMPKKGKIKLTYSVNSNGNRVVVDAPMQSGGSGMLVFINDDGNIYHSNPYADKNYLLCTGQSNQWITVENIIDTEKMSNECTVYNANGQKIGSVTVDKINNIEEGKSVSAITGIRFRCWNDNAPGVYIDDVKAACYYAKPELNAYDVTITDFAGNTHNLTNSVIPAVRSINLDFGCRLNGSTGAESIQLIRTNNGTVSYTPQINGEVYSMLLDTCLAQNSSYEIRILPTVESEEGMTFDTTLTLEFKTGTAAVSGKLIKATVGGEEIKAISQLHTGDTMVVDTAFANPSESTASMSVVAAYYAGDTLKKVEIISKDNISAGAVLNDSITVTVPDLTDVTEAGIFLWDSLNTLVPYCGVLQIN